VESRFGRKVRLIHNPNQSWNTYGLGIQDLESALAIFHLGILHLEKKDKEPYQRPLDFHQVSKCVDQNCNMPTHYYLKGREC
jgi:hypothetical protein